VEADRHQLKQHIDVVVRNAKVLLVRVRQDLEIEGQPVKDAADIDGTLEGVEVVAHQNDVEVGHRL